MTDAELALLVLRAAPRYRNHAHLPRRRCAGCGGTTTGTPLAAAGWWYAGCTGAGVRLFRGDGYDVTTRVLPWRAVLRADAMLLLGLEQVPMFD